MDHWHPLWWWGSVIVFLASALAMCLIVMRQGDRAMRLARSAVIFFKQKGSDPLFNSATVRGSGGGVFVIGDSIAASFGAPKALSRAMRDVLGCTVTTYGINGIQTKEHTRLAAAVGSPQFKSARTVIVSLGGNDGIRHRDFDEYAFRSSIRQAVAWFKLHMGEGQRLVWSTFPKEYWRLPSFRVVGPRQEVVHSVWSVMQDELRQLGIRTYAFPSWEERVLHRREMIGGDGLHPSAAGYALLAQDWASVLSQSDENGTDGAGSEKEKTSPQVEG